MRSLPSGCAVVQWVLGPAHRRSTRPEPFDLAASIGLRKQRRPDSTAARLWRQKAAEPLLAVRGRIGAQAASSTEAYAIIRQLASALKLADGQHATLRLTKSSPGRAVKLLEAARPLEWSVMNAAECAALLTWPLDGTNDDGLPTVGGHINPVPPQLLVAEDEAAEYAADRLLGESQHPAQRGDLDDRFQGVRGSGHKRGRP